LNPLQLNFGVGPELTCGNPSAFRQPLDLQRQVGRTVADHAARPDRGNGQRRRCGEARVRREMMEMQKIDVAKIEAAVRGEAVLR
jgi:hypothetical protein